MNSMFPGHGCRVEKVPPKGPCNIYMQQRGGEGGGVGERAKEEH